MNSTTSSTTTAASGEVLTNIKVYCRLRQQNQLEKREGASPCSTVIHGRTLYLRNERCDVDEIRCTFDRVFDVFSTQQEVYEHTAQPLVHEFLQGYNCTIFAYGQTGSGKTHTILGPKDGVLVKPEEEGGIISRVIKDLYKEVDRAKALGTNPAVAGGSTGDSIDITVSFVEIYMEQIRDLLAPTGNGATPANGGLKIRESAQRGVYIEEMTQVHSLSETTMMELVKTGSLNRAVSSTRMNKDSSRSHSILMITCTRREGYSGAPPRRSTMYIVDLAGSEFVNKTNASGKVLQEAKAINKSLSALSNVIKALVEGKKHVPYRDSKLTRLLQDSLGGSAKTCLILAASCSSYNMAETISTLRFGLRAKEIKNPVVTMKQDTAVSGFEVGGMFKELYQRAMEEMEEKNKKIDELQRLLSNAYQENQQQHVHDEDEGTIGLDEEGAVREQGRNASEHGERNERNEGSASRETEVDQEYATTNESDSEDEEVTIAAKERDELQQANRVLEEENRRLFVVLGALEEKLDHVLVDFSTGKPMLRLSSRVSIDDTASTVSCSDENGDALTLKVWLQSEKWRQTLEPRPEVDSVGDALTVQQLEHEEVTLSNLAGLSDSHSSFITEHLETAAPSLSIRSCTNTSDSTPCVHRLDAESLSRQIVELKLQLHYLSENMKLVLEGEHYTIVQENAHLKTRIEELEFQANLSKVTLNQLEMKNRACETRLSNQETHIGCLQNSLHEYQSLFKQQIIMSQEKSRLLTDELEFYKKLSKCTQQSCQHFSGSSSCSPVKDGNKAPSPRKGRTNSHSPQHRSVSSLTSTTRTSAMVIPPELPNVSTLDTSTSFGHWRGYGDLQSKPLTTSPSINESDTSAPLGAPLMMKAQRMIIKPTNAKSPNANKTKNFEVRPIGSPTTNHSISVSSSPTFAQRIVSRTTSLPDLLLGREEHTGVCNDVSLTPSSAVLASM